jgi:hypothetical protein
MARQYGTPIVLPADPTSALQAATKQYVDTADALAEKTANKGVASGYAGLDGATKVPIAQLPTGATSTTVTIGNDTRLSDSRTPTAHASTHRAGGSDAILSVVAAKSSAYTAVDTDEVILVTPAASTTITLPTAVGRGGKRFIVKKVFGAGFPVIIASAGGTIDSATTETIMVAGGFREFISDGTNWFICGGSVVPVLNTPTAPSNGGTLTVDATVASVFRLTPAVAGYTLATPTSPIDGMQINFEFTPSVTFSLIIASGILLTTGITTPIAVASGKKAFLGLRYSGSSWYLIASAVQT